MKTTKEKTESDPLDDAFVFLKSVPTLEQYRKMNAVEAYAIHASTLEEMAKQSDAAAIPVGSNAWERHTAAARRTRMRSRLCSLVADGQSVQAAIQAVFRDIAKKEDVHACGDPDCVVPHPAEHKQPPEGIPTNPTSKRARKSASDSKKDNSTPNSSVIPITSKRRSLTSNTRKTKSVVA